jgi:hypothetical protein
MFFSRPLQQGPWAIWPGQTITIQMIFRTLVAPAGPVAGIASPCLAQDLRMPRRRRRPVIDLEFRRRT